MSKKVIRKEGAVLSVQIEENLFTIAQMRENSLMEFFDLKSSSNNWNSVDLNLLDSLFCIFVADNKIKSLLVENLSPSQATPSRKNTPKLMLKTVFGNHGVHGADLIELTSDYSNIGGRVVKRNLNLQNDIELIHKYELVGMLGDPEELKRRLIRYFDTGINWDDTKKYIFSGIEPPAPKWIIQK